MLCSGDKQTPLVFNSWGSGWPGTWSNILKKKKYFKTDLSCKVLPKVSVESIQEKGITYVVFLVLQKETGSCNLSFPFKTLGLVVLQIRAFLIINLNTFTQNSRVSLSIPALNPGAHFLPLIISILCGSFFTDQGTFFCIKDWFSQTSSLLNDFFTGIWELI